MAYSNPELKLADDFVQFTDCNVFLTGKAGTGKTTFLHNLRNNSAKRMIITAPTGVAAINAGGVTLHSFFQLPFGPFLPGSETSEQNRQRQFRFSKIKKQIIKSLDLLVIDEISMVRADLLDAVDSVLRRHRRSNDPFGGVQLLMIGDLHQLSPVARQTDWQLLQEHYESVYFFSSKALARTEFVTIELKHIYRQADAGFIKILNQVRDNRLDQAGINELNRRYIPNFAPEEEEGYITLTTHNHSAEHINQIKLKKLPAKERAFQAEITGDFPEHIYPTAADLRLKEGAQVMFIRNDASPDKLYYNGKIGKITKISSQGISIKCRGEQQEIVVEPLTWENINYTVDDKTKEITEKIIGEFNQYPLKLAWAITIHKSQGLTFDKAVIDAEAAFAHGQV
jgi:ATP-dependent exoDNAse (exonuclease V) alpha subunit